VTPECIRNVACKLSGESGMLARSATRISGVLSNDALWAYRRLHASFHQIRLIQEIDAASRKAFFVTERLNKVTLVLLVTK
jgi:hypothetical protein